MTDEASTPDEGAPERPPQGHRPLRQLCPICNGKGTVLVPRFGMSSDDTSGTVHVEERCRACDGDGWLDRGFVRI